MEKYEEFTREEIIDYWHRCQTEYHKLNVKYDKLLNASQDLFDNRLGWSEKRNPYAPRIFWAQLSATLYGDNDPRTKELLIKDK